MTQDLTALLLNTFNKRELRLIRNSINYTNDDPAGLAGHNLMLIVAKLMALLEGEVSSTDDCLKTAIQLAEEGGR